MTKNRIAATLEMLGHTVANDYQEKGKSWNKSTKNIDLKTLKNSSLNVEAGEEKECQKRWMNDSNNSSNLNKSTLSLHIAAYENSIDDDANGSKDLSKKATEVKLDNLPLEPQFTDLFEFPRQMKSNKTAKSEVQQFKTSQRLFTPNQGASSSRQTPRSRVSRHVASTSRIASSEVLESSRPVSTRTLIPDGAVRREPKEFLENLKEKQTIFVKAKADLKWYRSKIQKVENKADGKIFLIHFHNWSNKFNECFNEKEAIKYFREHSIENAYKVQAEAVKSIYLPLSTYTMNNLGFPNQSESEKFSEFLKEHPEAFKSKVLKKPIIVADDDVEPEPFSSLSLEEEENVPMELDVPAIIPLPAPSPPTVAEVISEALADTEQLSTFVDNDLQKSQDHFFARLPARVTIAEIFNQYLKTFYDDKIANRQILAKNALQMFSRFALSKLVNCEEAPYILAVINVAREGKNRRTFNNLSSEIPLELDIFGYIHLCRLVKFAFIYYKNTPESENDESFRQLIKSWGLFAKFLKKSKRRSFDESLDYVKINY